MCEQTAQGDLAGRLGIDESTIAHWEKGINRPSGTYRNLVERFVGGNGSVPQEPGAGSEKNGFESWGARAQNRRRPQHLVSVGTRRPKAAWSASVHRAELNSARSESEDLNYRGTSHRKTPPERSR